VGRNILLLLGSFVLVIVLSEIMVRAFIPVRMVGSSFTVYDPVLGKRLKKNFSTIRKTPEFTIKFSTNSYSYRGPEPKTLPTRSILFLGDSFTMGYGVTDGEEYPAIIRATLSQQDPSIPVVNTGMGANGNGRWIKFLRTEAKSYDPRVVIIQLMANDFQDNVNERLFRLSADKNLVELPVPPIEMVRVVQNFVDNIPGLADSHLLGLTYQAYWSIGQGGMPAPAKTVNVNNMPNDHDELTYRILEEVVSICRQENWPMLAIVVGISGERAAEIDHRLRSADIPTINTPGRDERPDLFYEIDGHWNPAGHALVAELVLSKLASLKIP